MELVRHMMLTWRVCVRSKPPPVLQFEAKYTENWDCVYRLNLYTCDAAIARLVIALVLSM